MDRLELATDLPTDAPDGTSTLVLLHGRGATRHDLLGLRPYLPAQWAIVAPEAPFPAAPWGYGPGSAWYRFLGRNRPEPEGFSTSLERVGAFLAGLPGVLPYRPGALLLGGFSQGGTVSIAYAIAAAAGQLPRDVPQVAATVNLSGFLADHPIVHASLPHARGLHVFWGHGTEDANIPFALAAEGRAALVAAGAEVEARDYPIGHWIDANEVFDLVAWARRVVGA